MQNGLPFEVKIPSKKPIVYEDLSEEDFDREILKAMDDFDCGRVYTSEEIEKTQRTFNTTKILTFIPN